jgi:hypothetical protein
MSHELFVELLTEGWSWPSRDGERLVCVKGLPPDARLVDISHQLHFATNDVALKFESPSWPDPQPGDAIQEIEIRHRRESAPPIVIDLPSDMTPERRQELLEQLESAPRGPLMTFPARFSTVPPTSEMVADCGLTSWSVSDVVVQEIDMQGAVTAPESPSPNSVLFPGVCARLTGAPFYYTREQLDAMSSEQLSARYDAATRAADGTDAPHVVTGS